MLESIETWLLKLLDTTSVGADEFAKKLKALLRNVEGVQVDRLLFQDGPRVRVMFRTETEPKVSAAISTCVERYSQLSIEIQKRQNITMTTEYRDLASDTSLPSMAAAIESAELVVLKKITGPPSRCSVRVFYATDRHSLGPTYGKERNPNGTIALGACEVSIPHDHRMGLLERPSIFRFEFREDPEKHIVLQKIIPLGSQQFWQAVSARTQESKVNEAFVFVHGYCTTFEDAILRTAQIAYDLGFGGAPISYSWPSHGELADYPQDETNAQWSIPHLKNFLQALAQFSGVKTIHVIAHSMGNRIVSHALQLLYENESKNCCMRHIVLTAPDIDADTFKEMAKAVRSLADRVTIYCSSRDKALAMSKRFHGYPRLGETPLVIQGIDTIDASEVDTSLIGHSYYGENRSVLSDICLCNLLFGAENRSDWEQLLARAYKNARSGRRGVHQYISDFLRKVYTDGIHLYLESSWPASTTSFEDGRAHLENFEENSRIKRSQPDPHKAVLIPTRFEHLKEGLRKIRSEIARGVKAGRLNKPTLAKICQRCLPDVEPASLLEIEAALSIKSVEEIAKEFLAEEFEKDFWGQSRQQPSLETHLRRGRQLKKDLNEVPLQLATKSPLPKNSK